MSDSSRRSGLLPGVVLAIALFALGAAAHFGHHLADPGCDAGRTGAHPCAACSVLHGAALTESSDAVAPSAPSPHSHLQQTETVAHVAAGLGPCAPRAPPLG